MKLFSLTKTLQKPADARPLAFLRLATGLIALCELMALWPNLKDIYGSQGFIEWVISDNLFSIPHLPTIARVADVLNPQFISDNQVLYLVLGAYIFTLVGLVSGFKANLMAFFAWLLHLTINNSAIMYGYGVETFIHVSLFYLIFMPSSRHFTFFGKKQPAYTERQNAYVNLWMLILQAHLCIVYFNAGIAKMYGEDWTTGEAIWRSVAQPSYGQYNMFWLAYVPWLSIISTYVVLALESAYPVLIWLGFTRKYWLLSIIMMHVGIGVLMGLYAFAAIMIALNIAAFGWPYVSTLKSYLASKLPYFIFSNPSNPEVSLSPVPIPGEQVNQ